MSFEHCLHCLPPTRYPGCQDHCPYYAADIAKHRAARKEDSGKRRRKMIIWARGSLRRGATNERNEGAKR